MNTIILNLKLNKSKLLKYNMKKYLFTSFVLPALIFTVAAPVTAYTPGVSSVGLYRLYNIQTGEHFYTADYAEAFALRGTNYVIEGVEGSIFRENFYNSIPLYRLYNSSTDRHFYTTSDVELAIVIKQGFMLERREGYLASTTDSPSGATLANLYRLYNRITNDHFYTKNPSEADAAAQSGYTREGSMGYITD